MQTVADIPLDARASARGLHVIAWGFGRMRAGRILGVGPKNATLELQQNADGRVYRKAVKHSEVFIVPDGENGERIAAGITQKATRPATGRGRRSWIDPDEAATLAALFVT